MLQIFLVIFCFLTILWISSISLQIKVLVYFYRNKVPLSDVMILSPYSAQVTTIRNMIIKERADLKEVHIGTVVTSQGSFAILLLDIKNTSFRNIKNKVIISLNFSATALRSFPMIFICSTRSMIAVTFQSLFFYLRFLGGLLFSRSFGGKSVVLTAVKINMLSVQLLFKSSCCVLWKKRFMLLFLVGSLISSPKLLSYHFMNNSKIKQKFELASNILASFK